MVLRVNLVASWIDVDCSATGIGLYHDYAICGVFWGKHRDQSHVSRNLVNGYSNEPKAFACCLVPLE